MPEKKVVFKSFASLCGILLKYTQYKDGNARHSMQRWQCPTLNAKMAMSDTQCKDDNARHSMQRLECPTLHAKMAMPDTQCKDGNARHSMQRCMAIPVLIWAFIVIIPTCFSAVELSNYS